MAKNYNSTTYHFSIQAAYKIQDLRQSGTKVLTKFLKTGLLLAIGCSCKIPSPPPSPFNVEQKVPSKSNILWGRGGVAESFHSLFTDI